MDAGGLLAFTRMTGDLVKAMRACPQPIVAAVDGVCAGAGAILAMASDLRFATPRSKTAFLFARVGLAGCDMGACAILPRIIGQGRAAELLYTGRAMSADEGARWGFYNRVVAPSAARRGAGAGAQLADGPTFAHAMTKKMLHQEWSDGIDDAIEAEAQAQAICMQTAISGARTRRSRPSRSPCSRATDARNDLPHLDWPFFDDAHRALARDFDAWLRRDTHRARTTTMVDDDAAAPGCASSATPGICALACPGVAAARARRSTSTRCASRARRWPATTGSRISRSRCRGSAAARLRSRAREPARRWLPPVARGEAIAAFALSEPDAGSDVAGAATRARRDGGGLRARRRPRPGSRTAASRISTACSRAPARRRARRRRASRRSSWPPTRRGLESPSGST